MRNHSFRRTATLVALPLLLLAACGGGAPAPTGPASGAPTVAPTVAPTAGVTSAPTGVTSNVEACSLLTTAEVAAASGMELNAATPDSDSLYTYCKYSGGSSSDEVRTFVSKDAATAASVFATMKINAGQAVTGVGDEAYWSTDSFQPGLYFLKGGQLGFISGSSFGPDDLIVQLGILMASRM